MPEDLVSAYTTRPGDAEDVPKSARHREAAPRVIN